MNLYFEDGDYATGWEISSKDMFEHGYYDWMCKQICGHGYKNILEVGSGVGYNTLALIKNGFSVISMDKDENCVDYAKKICSKSGYKIGDIHDYENSDVVFILNDILFNSISFEDISIDLIVCWNVGIGELKKAEIHKLVKVLRQNGFNEEYKTDNDFLDDYCQCLHEKVFEFANYLDADVHLIDRDTLPFKDNADDSYYGYLMKNFSFSNMEIRNIEDKHELKHGIELKKINQNEEKLFFGSILYSN